MNETPHLFNNDELTTDDLAVLQAFEAMEDWNTEEPASPLLSSPTTQDSLDTSLDDMFYIFVSEADENVTIMRRALNQLEHDDYINPSCIVALQRSSHKMRGTAGSLEYHSMERIAAYIEVIAEQIIAGDLYLVIGKNAFPTAVQALETTLKDLITSGKESDRPLLQLEEQLQRLDLDLAQLLLPSEKLVAANDQSEVVLSSDEQVKQLLSVSEPHQQNLSVDTPTINIDLRRVETLVLHSHHLEELRTPLEGAQAQVERALQELYAAQARLQLLGPSVSSLFTSPKHSNKLDEHPTSSLIARILNEASQKNDTHHPRKTRSRARTARIVTASRWDDLEVERFSEQDILIRSLNETIVDVTIATSRVRLAFMNLKLAQQEYVAQASTIRNDTLLLRLVPLASRIPLLQHEITKYAATLGLQIQLEAEGEMTEIDQDILDTLTGPLHPTPVYMHPGHFLDSG